MKVLITFFALLFSGLLAATTLNNIVVFGDSLSDNGNLYEFMQHRIPNSPPYFEGRFTNGPVWIERLTSMFYPSDGAKHLLDYAFGGAGISEELDDDVLFTLKREIDVYLLAHQGKADPESLFVIWMGANNYLAIPEDFEKTVVEVNNGIRHDLERLAAKGAQHILVLNLPDLGRSPAAREFDAEEQLTYLVNQHNKTLTNTILSLQESYPNVNWIYFDVNHSLDDILTSPERFGFNNIKDTCYDVAIEKTSRHSVIQMAAKIKKTDSKDSCEGYLFFDPVHPTAPAHQIMAERAHDLLVAAGIEFK